MQAYVCHQQRWASLYCTFWLWLVHRCTDSTSRMHIGILAWLFGTLQQWFHSRLVSRLVLLLAPISLSSANTGTPHPSIKLI
jgi:hypothetical protein